MAEVKWTPEQLTAIEARDGTLLVSAAAGSGKTAVLVERVIRRITDESNPCSVDNLLVVTFTNAAAAQMKRKISEAITKKIIENADNAELRRQQTLLPFASICTIDSFCINLVRDNFQSLGVSPDFALLDASRLAILKNEAINTVLDGLYAENSEGFARLYELVCDSRDDSGLVEAIKKLYEISRAYPFPERWLSSLVEGFRTPQAIEKSVWGREIYDYLRKMLDYCLDNTRRALEVIELDEIMLPKYQPALLSDLEAYERLKAVLDEGDWDTVFEEFAAMNRKGAFMTLGRAPTGYDSDEKQLSKALRDAAKAELDKKNLAALFVATQAEHEEDLRKLLPAVECLIGAVNAFARQFAELKKSENGADFSDTLHYALELLAKVNEDGSVCRTPLAEELSRDYTEILIDEYQDVNEAQDLLFKLISKNESNLFMVGDVKQSIYGFRQAMPEIFLEKRNRFPFYENGNYPATVILGKNFRSRKGVTENVNYVFSRLMTGEIGGLEYGEADRLYYNEGQYLPHDEADAELHIIDSDKKDADEREGEYIADYIANNRGRLLVRDGSSQRPAEYGDFCVLLRSLKGRAAVIVSALEKRGIPVVCDTSGSFFEAPEIRFMLSLLRLLDNPVDDVSLLAVMLSPVFGFTPDELALIRAEQRRGSIYHSLRFAADNGSEKCSEFLRELERLRRISVTVCAQELVRRLLDETGYFVTVSVMKDAHLRRANLRLLIDYAAQYEATGRSGLSGFLRYIDRAEKSGIETQGAENVSQSANVVRIMTIHKSKGLEFPVCILAGCGHELSTGSLKENMIISQSCGIGMKCAGAESFVRFNTIPRVAARLETLTTERAEELRVLYVALTRAKEKIVITAAMKQGDSRLRRAALSRGQTVAPFAVLKATCYGELVAAALIRHPDAAGLRTLCGAESVSVLPAPERLKIVLASGEIEPVEAEPTEQEEFDTAEKLAQIMERLEYRYPFEQLERVAAKRVASDFSHGAEGFEFFASARPAFMSRGELTPSQRGTANHKFMQLADFESSARSVAAELERLRSGGDLSPAEAGAVEQKKIEAFFSSELARRIFASPRVYRELSFTCGLPASRLYPQLDGEAGDETVVIDGVADCVFVEDGEAVVVDYKTDRGVTEQELVRRYSPQLEIYRSCLAETLGIPVKEALIYSFFLEKTVEID